MKNGFQIRRMTQKEVAEIADVSAEAFIANNDPIGNFMFQNEPNHLVLKGRFFRSLVTSCSPKAVRQGVSPALEAVSIWFPPGMDHSGDMDADPFRPQRGKMKNNKVIGILLLILAVSAIIGIVIDNAAYRTIYNYATIIISTLSGIILLKQK